MLTAAIMVQDVGSKVPASLIRLPLQIDEAFK